MPHLLFFFLAPLAAYLLGSLPFALVIGKANGVDIRTTGSKNIGATNLGRALGLRFFFYAFFLDAAKGFLPVLAIDLFAHYGHGALRWAPLLTAAAAVLGHLFPLYLGFKGGKGVATSFGAVLGIWPVFTLAGLAAMALFLVVFLAWRYISLASIIAALAFPLFVLVFGAPAQSPLPFHTHLPWSDLAPLLAAAILLALLVVFKHRTNLRRLVKGTEPKFHQSPKPPPPPTSNS